MSNNSTLKSVFIDLQSIFKDQFDLFVKQFLDSEVDLDKFFEDAEVNFELLNNVINEWCENENPSDSENIKASAAIFMMAFIDKVDKESALESEGEETTNSGPLG
jgi:hypothetical protein